MFMILSPNYNRVKALMRLSSKPLASGDYEEDTRAGSAHTEVDSAKGTSEDFVIDLSVGESQTKTGADGWLSSFIQSANRHMECITTVKARHLSIRESMSTAVSDGENLSPILISEADSEASKNTPLTLTDADGKTVEYVDSGAYLTALAVQRNRKREAEAQAILDKLNQDGETQASDFRTHMDDYVPDAWKPQSAPDQGNVPSPRSAFPAGSRGYVPTVRADTVAGSGTSEWKSPAPGKPGSASNPITDPADLDRYDLTTMPVNQRMTPNGPVGGHMPADVLNANDPAWRVTAPTDGGGARIVGGMLVAGSTGAAGAALAHGGGFAGIGGLATGASGAAFRSVAPAGGVLRPSALTGGGIAGRGAVGGAGMRTGMAPVGSGTSGSRAVSARGGAGAAGRSGATGGGRAGSGAAERTGMVGTTGQSAARSGGAGSRGTAETRGKSGVATAGRGGLTGTARGGDGAGSRAGDRASRAAAGVVRSGSSKTRDKKEQVQRRNYDVVRVDGLDEPSVGIMGGAAGSADQLKPIARDSGEDW